jgi:hypothetical protein
VNLTERYPLNEYVLQFTSLPKIQSDKPKGNENVAFKELVAPSGSQNCRTSVARASKASVMVAMTARRRVPSHEAKLDGSI